MKNNYIKNNKGYTLLFAVLVSSIVLAVGISILTISKKEYLLSSSARESTIAFYAADSGLECATYYTQGINSGNFSTTTSTASLNCFNTDYLYSPTGLAVGTFPITFSGDTFTFHLKTGTSACAIVTVRQYTTNDPILGVIPVTTIISKGYNLGWIDSLGTNPNTCTASSPRRVERAIEYTF